MKNKEVLDLINLLSSFKLNKLDDEVANVILSNLTKIVPYNETFTKVQEQLRKFTIETLGVERLTEFETKRVKFLELSTEDKKALENDFIKEFEDVITQQTRFNKALTNYLLKDVDLELDKIDYKLFVKNSKNLDVDLTYSTLLILKPMLDNFETTSVEVSENDIKELLN